MKVLKKGNYKLQDWSLEVECTGKGWHNDNRPCHSILKLEDGDIVKRKYQGYGESCPSTYYGFICNECHCFTEIDESLIPDEIKRYCPQVAGKGSDYYSELTDEEKKLSEVL